MKSSDKATIVCEDTGERAIDGCCPIHGGDACLYDVSQMRDYVNGATGLRDKHAAKVIEMFNEAAALRAELQDAGNVLALIHRDGGHHISKVGWKQACTDAEEIVTKSRAEVDGLREALISISTHGDRWSAELAREALAANDEKGETDGR